MKFPCYKGASLSIPRVCDNPKHWKWEKGIESGDPCKPVKMESTCIIYRELPIPCGAAIHGTCPNSKLQALINAWIQMKKTGRN